MKATNLFFPALLLMTVFFTACAGNPENNNARSVNVDSSNVHGAAPVQYGADDPADTTPKLEASDDTGRRANTEQR
ncbi:hypothetical protein [Taibaiella koreensis]|uniref:hypothetical protein n=1 Tax=Taibaiella koreensis TaxID=1268548 RepID=UPI000E59DDDD|nr:hypothetical protein [Taibaiella koreensis]